MSEMQKLEEVARQYDRVVAQIKVLTDMFFKEVDPDVKMSIFEEMIILGVTKEGMEMLLAGEYEFGDN